MSDKDTAYNPESSVTRQGALKRRGVLSGIVGGFTTIVGSTPGKAHHKDDHGNPPHRIEIVDDPYEGIDWHGVEYHKSEFHNHSHRFRDSSRNHDGPSAVAELYQGSGTDRNNGNTLPDREAYTIFATADKGDDPMAWPWTDYESVDYSDAPGGYRDSINLDPESMGVVSFPGAEMSGGDEHVSSIFSTFSHGRDYQATRHEQIEDVIENETDDHVPSENGGLVVMGHPFRYYDDPDTDWDRYVPDFDRWSNEDGLVGLEVLNKESSPYGGRGGNLQDITLWDNLLSHYAPERPMWATGVDDPSSGEFNIGDLVDTRWTTILLNSGEFDPSDQHGTRVSAADAFINGQLFAHERPPWDADSEDPASVPHVTSIDINHNAGMITIAAEHAETIEWVSEGDVVETGPRIKLRKGHEPYVRAQLSNEVGGLTLTQPWSLVATHPRQGGQGRSRGGGQERGKGSRQD